MAGLKTKPTNQSVKKFLDSIEDQQRRDDCYAVAKLMQDVTKAEPKMWGDSIVGFGEYHYKYATGREGDWFLAGFSPRKQNLTLYIMPCMDNHEELLGQLGKIKHGKSCIYINKLEDIDSKVLKKMVRESIKAVKKLYG